MSRHDAAGFGRSFVRSEAFKALFREGMELVDDAAAYLDGPGRREEGRLGPAASRAYLTESMGLTARLMQIAAWLLVQRAVADGEIGPEQAVQERNRLQSAAKAPAAAPTRPEDFEALPRGFRNLIGLSARLHARILHIDLLIAEEQSGDVRIAGNPVAAQQSLIARAFGGDPQSGGSIR